MNDYEIHHEIMPISCVCDDCETGKQKHCGHAYGRHYDIWGEGLGTPDYCPQKCDPNDPNSPPW